MGKLVFIPFSVAAGLLAGLALGKKRSTSSGRGSTTRSRRSPSTGTCRGDR